MRARGNPGQRCGACASLARLLSPDPAPAGVEWERIEERAGWVGAGGTSRACCRAVNPRHPAGEPQSHAPALSSFLPLSASPGARRQDALDHLRSAYDIRGYPLAKLVTVDCFLSGLLRFWVRIESKKIIEYYDLKKWLRTAIRIDFMGCTIDFSARALVPNQQAF